MGPLEKNDERIRQALAAAHRARTGPVPDESWDLSVMNAIGRRPRAPAGPAFAESLGGLFWRLSPVACAVIIILALAMFRYDPSPQFDLAQFLTDDAVDTVLLYPNTSGG